jgi:hypothetical protein
MSEESLTKIENIAKLLNDAATTFKGSVEHAIEGLSDLLDSANKAATLQLGMLYTIAQDMESASVGNQRAAKVMLEASEANSRAASQMAEAAEVMMQAAYRMRD